MTEQNNEMHDTDASEDCLEANSETHEKSNRATKPKKHRFCGAYWYVPTDLPVLTLRALIRDGLTIGALILQFAVLLFPQGGLEYVTNNISSLALVYMWTVIIMLGVSIYTVVMDFTRYKPNKRIPKEWAPKRGYKLRANFCTELFVVVNALVFGFELAFVCIRFDGVGLAAMLVTLLALGAAVAARVIEHGMLKCAEFVPAAEDPEKTEKT